MGEGGGGGERGGGGLGGGCLSKNERNFVGGLWASVTKRYMGVGGSLKHQKKKRAGEAMVVPLYPVKCCITSISTTRIKKNDPVSTQ